VPSGLEGYGGKQSIISRLTSSVVNNRGAGFLQPARLSHKRCRNNPSSSQRATRFQNMSLIVSVESVSSLPKPDAVFRTEKKRNSKVSQKAIKLTPFPYRPTLVEARLKRDLKFDKEI
jgi:hypothetical protein